MINKKVEKFMSESFEYKLNPAYCIYKGVAIESQLGSQISFWITDKNSRKTVKTNFYNYVDYVRSLKECPPEYSKRPSVKFKMKKKDEIEKIVGKQIGNFYSEQQIRILEKICSEEKGFVVIASESKSKKFNSVLHLNMYRNRKKDFLVEKWEENGKEKILKAVNENKLIFVEMEKSNLAEVISELLQENGLREEFLLENLKGVIVQDTHEFLEKEDLLADIAIFNKNKLKKSLMKMNDDEKENSFIHYTNFGNVLRESRTRMIGKSVGDNKNLARISVFMLMFCVILVGMTGCNSCKSNTWKHKEIRDAFVNTCLGYGFSSLNEWQKFYREKFSLDYIGWCRAENFLVDKFSQKGNLPLYYGCWKSDGKNIRNKDDSENKREFGEIYCRKPVKKTVYDEDFTVPYRISGELDYSGIDINLRYWFFNNTNKNIRTFTIVFYIFDEDGNPPINSRNNVILEENKFVEYYSNLSKKINLNDYFDMDSDKEYSLDYLYVSKIEFADGTVWSDPFGMKYLN